MTINKNKIEKSEYSGLEIAVIGMAGRFPGANNIKDFWNNLKNGKESISFFSDDQLEKMDISPGLIENPNYVKAMASASLGVYPKNDVSKNSLSASSELSR